MRHLIEVILDAWLMTFYGVTSTYLFYNIRDGSVYKCYEYNKVIVGIELWLAIMMLVYGVYKIWRAFQYVGHLAERYKERRKIERSMSN